MPALASRSIGYLSPSNDERKLLTTDTAAIQATAPPWKRGKSITRQTQKTL